MSDLINITVNPDGDEVTINIDDSAGAAVFAAAAEASAIAAAAAASTAAADATALAEAAADDAEDAAAAALVAQQAAQAAAADAVAAVEAAAAMAEAAADDAEDAAAAALVAQQAAQAAAADAVAAVEGAASDAADSVQAAVASDAQAAAASATQASGYKDAAAGSASAASNSADQAASFVGGNWPLPHSHVTGPVAVDPEYSRLSDAYDSIGKRWEYNQRPWNDNGTEIWEGTTNLLPAGAENFVTGWASYGGETITVTDYPVYIAELGKTVIAKRITGNGAGTVREKYLCNFSGVSNPHTSTVSCWAMVLSGTAQISERSEQQVVQIPGTMQRISSTSSNIATTTAGMYLLASAPTNIIDVVLYAPQLEIKATATPYTPPGTTRAAATLSIPVGATQKNLLTLNQATGGDTLGDTTGFTKFRGTETITIVTDEKWNGTGSIKVVTPGDNASEGVTVSNSTFSLVIGKIYTATLFAWGSGTVGLGANNIPGTSSPVVLSGTKQRLSYTFVATTVSTNGPCLITNSAQAATFYIDGLQLEEGTTASDFTLPAVDYTNALIDPAQPFSIEFDATPWVDDKSAAKYLFGIGNSTNYIRLVTSTTDGYYRISHQYNNGTQRNITSSVAVVAGTKVNHKISVSSGQVIYSLNGVDIGTGTFDGLPSLFGWLAYLGAYIDGTLPRNASITNVRIRKGVALSVAERAYTGQLVADEYTTFCSNLKESISSRPFVKVNGVGQNVVLAGDSPNQNAIINGDFRLASRGTSFTDPASGAKILDGMFLGKNGTGGTLTISQQSFTSGQVEINGAEKYLRINQSVAPTGQTSFYCGFPVEDVAKYSGKKCIASIWARSPEQVPITVQGFQYFGSGGSSGVYPAIGTNIKTKPNWQKARLSFPMPSVAGKTIGAGNCFYLQIYFPYNSVFTLDLADIELKPADAPYSYYRRDIQMLQQLGARTLQKLPANLQLRAVNVQANYIDFESVVLPVEMRATPALAATYAETTNWKVLSTAAVQTTGFSWALLNASANQVAFRATKTSHGLTDATLQLVTNVLLSAEL